MMDQHELKAVRELVDVANKAMKALNHDGSDIFGSPFDGASDVVKLARAIGAVEFWISNSEREAA